GIALEGTDWQPVKSFLKRHHITYRVALGDENLFDRFGGVGIPYSLLLDRSMRGGKVYRGPVDREVLENGIRALGAGTVGGGPGERRIEVGEPAQKGSLRRGAAARRREVRRCLADFGLVRRPLRLWRARRMDESAPPGTVRFAAALERLGPVFAAFGGYLASRVDLLSPEQRRSLTGVA